MICPKAMVPVLHAHREAVERSSPPLKGEGVTRALRCAVGPLARNGDREAVERSSPPLKGEGDREAVER